MVNKQDYLNAINQDIEMVRGDTLAFNFQLHGLGTREAYEALTVKFAIVEHYGGDLVAICENDDGITLNVYDEFNDLATFCVSLAPIKTTYLDLTRYYYDLQIEDETNVLTLMRGHFTLLYNVN